MHLKLSVVCPSATARFSQKSSHAHHFIRALLYLEAEPQKGGRGQEARKEMFPLQGWQHPVLRVFLPRSFHHPLWPLPLSTVKFRGAALGILTRPPCPAGLPGGGLVSEYRKFKLIRRPTIAYMAYSFLFPQSWLVTIGHG